MKEIQIPLHTTLIVTGIDPATISKRVNYIQGELSRVDVDCVVFAVEDFNGRKTVSSVEEQISYPVSRHVVIVGVLYDMRSIECIKKINEFSKNNMYTKMCLYEITDAETHQSVDKSLSKHGFSNYEILSASESIDVKTPNKEEYKKHILDENINYLVIGDIHGCYDEFVELLYVTGFTYNSKISRLFGGRKIKSDDIRLSADDVDRQIILIGDLIDKGPKSKEVLQFVVDNQDRIKVVTGNHERSAYKAITGSPDIKPEISSYFDTVDKYKKDRKFKELLEEVVGISHPFLMHSKFVVTHAPCMNRAIGKLSNEGIRQQRIFSSPKPDDFDEVDYFLKERDKHFEFLKRESNIKHPIHMFGHEPFKNVFIFNNKYGIDTGCVHGGRLTAMQYLKQTGDFGISFSLPAKRVYSGSGALYDIFESEMM